LVWRHLVRVNKVSMTWLQSCAKKHPATRCSGRRDQRQAVDVQEQHGDAMGESARGRDKFIRFRLRKLKQRG
jgi:hypothetical protein